MSMLNTSQKKKAKVLATPCSGGAIITYPNLAQMAFDLFAIPAISFECKRAFSKASYTISARRSNLSRDIVEGSETL